VRLIDELILFFTKEERFLLIDIRYNSIILTRAFVRWSDKKIRIASEQILDISLIDETERATALLKRACSSILNASRYSIVVVTEPRASTTVHTSSKIIREEFQKPIDDSDLDNYISQSIWKVFDRYRAWSSQKMGIEEMDLIVADVKIRNFNVDGHRVLRPMDFSARTIEVFLNLTFAPRKIIEAIHSSIPKNSNSSFNGE